MGTDNGSVSGEEVTPSFAGMGQSSLGTHSFSFPLLGFGAGCWCGAGGWRGKRHGCLSRWQRLRGILSTPFRCRSLRISASVLRRRIGSLEASTFFPPLLTSARAFSRNAIARRSLSGIHRPRAVLNSRGRSNAPVPTICCPCCSCSTSNVIPSPQRRMILTLSPRFIGPVSLSSQANFHGSS
jgi:hypothetical protein